MPFCRFSSGRPRGRFVSTQRERTARTLAAAIEGLEQRFLFSTSLSSSLASWQANTPLVVVTPSASSTLSAPFTPSQVRQAYGLNQVADQGSGQTIAIIDAYNDPDIVKDANTFSGSFGLQAFNTTGGPTLTVENEYGSTSNLPANAQLNAPNGQDWDVEESLDVEWAHTVAPMANIILFEANSPSFQDLFTAVATAAGTPGVSTVSMSFSGGEFQGEQTLDNTFTAPAGHAGVTFVAATGDSSFPGGFPAVSQNVLAVGGTSLTINSNGSYGGESAWSGGGGNISDYESQPVYQNLDASRYSLTQRTSPDVSWLADPNTGVVVLDSYSYGNTLQQIGGTSLATPMWAALISIVDQGRAASGLGSLDSTQTHALLYDLPESDFNDITSGNNGYPAVAGYDVATGLGSPSVPSLFSALTSDNAIYVDAGAPGTVQNGSSWTDAYTSLQTALGVATPGTTILVAQGTLTPISGTDPTATFQLENGVTLLGGFSGYGTTNPFESGAGFTTTLSGDISNAGDSYHVVTGSGTNSTAILDGFTISGGDADGSGSNQMEGSGLLDISGSPTIADCTFVQDTAGLNGAGGYGGGVYNSSSTGLFLNCTFNDDSADGVGGGGMFNLFGSPTLTDCVFTDDQAGSGANGYGGGIYNDLSSPALTNCLFNDNLSDDGGGGIYDTGASPSLINCTFANNTATGAFGDGGAIDNSVLSTPTLTNCIVWANSATQIGGIYNDFNSSATVTYSDIQSSYAGTGNINADPMFANSALGNLKLQAGSPCIDAGSNAAVPSNVTVDLAGLARIAGTTVDIGAYESQTLYVDQSAQGTGSGGTWANAFVSLATAMDFVQWGQTVDVAQGTYTPTPTTNRAATFELLDNVAIYGGYAGAKTSNPSARNVTAYPTILSGDIGTAGNNSDNSYHVVSILTNVSPTAILDGFTITGGNANAGGDGNSSLGGGIFEVDGSPTINDCIITGNQANGAATAANDNNSDGWGAGMFDFEGSPTISNCTFSGNTTTGQYAFGAAMMDEFADPTLLNCTFSNNTDNGQENYGAALFSYSSGETFTGCNFTGNTANNPGYGGAIAADSSSPTLTNCVFNGNTATGSDPFEDGWGGAIIDYATSTPTLTNCTFTNNFADLAGAIANFGGSTASAASTSTLTNCIAYGDSDYFGYEIYDNGDGSSATITYSDISGGFAGTGNINANPLFVNSAAGNLALQPTSPCINTGNNAAIQATGVSTDIAGDPRILGGTVDMGAYEAAFGPIVWTGGGDGISWSEPSNWSDNEIPTQNTSVTIPAGFANIQIGGGAYSVAALNSFSPLEVQAGASLKLYGAATETGSLTIDNGGTLDIQNNSLTINFTSSATDPIAAIQSDLLSGYNNDTWTGTGIISSNAAADPGMYAVGYADGNNDTGTPAGPNQIYIQNTLSGDANLDDIVNFPDLLVVAQNYGKTGADWAHGAFNYNGIVNFPDLLLVAQNYGKQLAAGQSAQTPSSFAPAFATSAAVLPAPTFFSAPTMAAPMMPFPIAITERPARIVGTAPPVSPATTSAPATPAPAARTPLPASHAATAPILSLLKKRQHKHTAKAFVVANPLVAAPSQIVDDAVSDVWNLVSASNDGPLFSDTILQ